MEIVMQRGKGNESVSQKDIFRLAASLYAEMTDVFSTQEVVLHVIKCVFTKTGNAFATVDDTLFNVANYYKLIVTEDELIAVFSRWTTVFQKDLSRNPHEYRLVDTEYALMLNEEENSIDAHIHRFIQVNNILDVDGCQEAIYKYLYELTTSNINSYKAMLSSIVQKRDFNESDLSVDAALLTDSERDYVHSFLEWSDEGKNVALSNIVLCCLEYCLVVSGDKDNKLVSSYIRDRIVYLDTNIIFRALGINGTSRQKVILSFLKKCQQAKIKIIVSSFTKREFFDTVEYYTEQISLFPRGEIYLGAYETLSDYNMYAYYNEWHSSHANLSFKYFLAYIRSSYDRFIQENRILDKETSDCVNVFSADAVSIRDSYARDILAVKKEIKDKYYNTDEDPSQQFVHDATLVYIAEHRMDCSEKAGKDCFIISTDKALRFWDMTRKERKTPIVIYPSQLFLILIKICGRSENDMASFVNFINVRKKSQQLTPEKANVVLSGISSITEDISSQKLLVESVFDDDFQNVLKNSNTDRELYENVRFASQKYLEEELQSKNDALQCAQNTIHEKIQAVATMQSIVTATIQSNTEIEKAKKDAEQLLAEKSRFIDEQREVLCGYAERKTHFAYCIIWYIIP